jgi:hypothetical protein
MSVIFAGKKRSACFWRKAFAPFYFIALRRTR